MKRDLIEYVAIMLFAFVLFAVMGSMLTNRAPADWGWATFSGLIGTFVGAAFALQLYRYQVRSSERRARTEAVNIVQEALSDCWYLLLQYQQNRLEEHRQNQMRFYTVSHKYMAEHWLSRFDIDKVLFIVCSDGRRLASELRRHLNFISSIQELSRYRARVIENDLESYRRERNLPFPLPIAEFLNPAAYHFVASLKSTTDMLYELTDLEVKTLPSIISLLRESAIPYIDIDDLHAEHARLQMFRDGRHSSREVMDARF